MKKASWFAMALVCAMVMASCHHGASKDDDDDDGGAVKATGKIEVQVANPRTGTISQSINLNATTVFQLNDVVRAPIAGYIRKINVTPGQQVKAGDVLFTLQTKEAAALGSIKDSTFKGAIQVKATEAGVVKSVARQMGDYMQDGDELCTIANDASLVFMLDVPFETRRYIKMDRAYTVNLPDGSTVQTHIVSQAPGMDRSVQMEKFVLRSASALNLPEGLIGTVRIPTMSQTNATILPKTAVLSNETQTEFWVMKLVHDSVAIKVGIEKGIESNDSVQINSPAFAKDDKILVSGNYGLPDTVKVKVVQATEKE